MIPKEIFQKVRWIEITTSRLVADVFAGQYHSVFKGQGIEFDEVREYQIGDDIRTIDWNVTARTGRPHVKKFIEERELTVMILVDASLSCRFASVNTLKSQLAAEIAAVLAFSAIRNNDRVGLIIFTDRIEKFIPARKGLTHVLRVIREVLYGSTPPPASFCYAKAKQNGRGCSPLDRSVEPPRASDSESRGYYSPRSKYQGHPRGESSFQPQGQGTDIAGALEYLNRVTTKKTIAFLISDFFEEASDFQKAMTVANKRHDMIAITLNDPKELQLPDCALMSFEDAETGQMQIVDTSDATLRRQYYQSNLERLKQRQRLFRLMGVDYIDISTDSAYADALVKFFLKRRKRR